MFFEYRVGSNHRPFSFFFILLTMIRYLIIINIKVPYKMIIKGEINSEET